MKLMDRLLLVKLPLLGRQVRCLLFLGPYGPQPQAGPAIGRDTLILISLAKPLVIEDVEVAPPKKDEVRIKVL